MYMWGGQWDREGKVLQDCGSFVKNDVGEGNWNGVHHHIISVPSFFEKPTCSVQTTRKL